MVIQAPVAHVCNLRYLGGRDQEDHGFRPAKVKSSQDGITTVKAGCGGTHMSFQLLQETELGRSLSRLTQAKRKNLSPE
jgi:hypothetical protein